MSIGEWVAGYLWRAHEELLVWDHCCSRPSSISPDNGWRPANFAGADIGTILSWTCFRSLAWHRRHTL